MKHLEEAKDSLKAAIERHKRHMNGTEATDEASQKKMMQEMMTAYDALTSMKMSVVPNPARHYARGGA
ncbi:MAG: hypothetical protein ACYCZR_08125 [Burkholderiales bacterium]